MTNARTPRVITTQRTRLDVLTPSRALPHVLQEA